MKGRQTSGGAKMLKGGLHCHTTRSDGAGDPGDVMRLHAKNGCGFPALTQKEKGHECQREYKTVSTGPGEHFLRAYVEVR